MNLLHGVRYNLKGMRLALATPRLLMLGLLRFVIVVAITLVAAGLVLAWNQELISMIWSRPESAWLVWLWHLVSWLMTLLLIAVSTVAAYIMAQILFGVFIMDKMSRITEKLQGVSLSAESELPPVAQFLFLLKQEIPRALFPILISLFIMLAGWLTPLGPVVTLLSSLVAAIFLAWDNTDLVPARQFIPFGERFRFLGRTLLFHIGFGLLFLIPLANMVFLSFAPVGATLYQIDRAASKTARA
jgi:CysZ protein